MPQGPPVGSALVEKLDLIISWVFMPIFYAKNGLVLDLCALRLKNYTILQSTALVGAFGKFMGSFSDFTLVHQNANHGCYLAWPCPECPRLSRAWLVLKCSRAIDNEAFVVMCTSMILITGGITPIIKRLYDPSKRYMVYKRRTVMHARPNSQLPVLVGIHDQEDVEPTINLLQALLPHRKKPSCHLSPPSHRACRPVQTLCSSPTSSQEGPPQRPVPRNQLSMPLEKYEQRNESLVTVHPFTAISPCATMHDDVCTIALDKKTSLIIVPFYKRFHARKQRMINKNVLEKAPCSVAILVHHGGLFDSSFNSRSGAMTLTCQNESCYNVAILFLGGADDREALAFGARMAAHPNINLTLVRLLVDGSITNTSEDVEDSRLDCEVLSEFREGMADNYRVMYIEELVMDGSGTMAVIRSMENNYELVIAGRNQDKRSLVLSGFMDENEQSELGSNRGGVSHRKISWAKAEFWWCNNTPKW
ncbi:hypothetical protein GBA52_029024 [Prunus armeniaca]|nr:hypothetical protein GBA52_029024 [Prunus armeniaca]